MQSPWIQRAYILMTEELLICLIKSNRQPLLRLLRKIAMSFLNLRYSEFQKISSPKGFARGIVDLGSYYFKW